MFVLNVQMSKISLCPFHLYDENTVALSTDCQKEPGSIIPSLSVYIFPCRVLDIGLQNQKECFPLTTVTCTCEVSDQLSKYVGLYSAYRLCS